MRNCGQGSTWISRNTKADNSMRKIEDNDLLRRLNLMHFHIKNKTCHWCMTGLETSK